MSNALLKQRAYSDADWKKASRIERFFIYMQEPDRFALTETEYRYFENVQQAFHIVSKKLSLAASINMILESKTIRGIDTWYAASKLVNDVQELYGNIIKRNKDFQRAMIIEKLTKLYKKANKEGNITEARRCLMGIAKIDRLDEPDEHVFDPSTFLIPAPIFTSDPKALEEVQDAEYEEISKDGD